MARVQFRVEDSVYGSLGLPANPMTNIRQQVEPPPGPLKDFLTSVGYPFSGDRAAFLTARVSKDIFELGDLSLFSAFDQVTFGVPTLAGALRNYMSYYYSSPRIDAAVQGSGVTVQSYGVKTPGASGHVDLGLATNNQRFTLNSACVWAYIEEADPTPNTPLIGRGGSGSDVIRLYPNSHATLVQAIGRLNSPTGISGFYSGSPLGFWLLQRTGASSIELWHNEDLVASANDNAATELAPAIMLGRNSGSYGAFGVSSFGHGRALSASERDRLRKLCAMHSAVLKA